MSDYKKDIENYEYFKVPGAGEIEISKYSNSECGVTGFTFGVSWGEHGYTGGVLGKKEALRLANFIKTKLKINEKIKE